MTLKNQAISQKYLRIHQIAYTSDQSIERFERTYLMDLLIARREIARIIDKKCEINEESQEVQLFNLYEVSIKEFLSL